jgi:hypothetical protein
VAEQWALVGASESVGKCDVGVVRDETLDFNVQVWKSGNHLAEERSIASGARALARGRVIVDCVFGDEVVEKVKFSAVDGITELLLRSNIHFSTHLLTLFLRFTVDQCVDVTGDRVAVKIVDRI